jgi:hypothetical protein
MELVLIAAGAVERFAFRCAAVSTKDPDAGALVMLRDLMSLPSPRGLATGSTIVDRIARGNIDGVLYGEALVGELGDIGGAARVVGVDGKTWVAALVPAVAGEKHDAVSCSSFLRCILRTNSPCLSSQLKYLCPMTLPSFFPRGSSSSTPTHSPGEKDVAPM